MEVMKKGDERKGRDGRRELERGGNAEGREGGSDGDGRRKR